MSRRNIAHLGLPKLKYSASLLARKAGGNSRFETKAAAALEDTIRVGRSRTACLTTAADNAAAQALAERLASGDWKGGWPVSLASSRYMRDQRNRVTGAVWKLVDETEIRVATFTLVAEIWRFSADELYGVSPEKLLAALRSDLNRAGGDATPVFSTMWS